jgi:hypothetical protein
MIIPHRTDTLVGHTRNVMCCVKIKGYDKIGTCYCDSSRPLSWAEVRHMVEKKSGVSQTDNGTTVYIGHLDNNGEDVRNLVVLADAYEINSKDTIVVHRLPSGYKCEPWFPLHFEIEVRSSKKLEVWRRWSDTIAAARGSKASEATILNMCKIQQRDGVLGYMDERWLSPHPSDKYVKEKYHAFRVSETEVVPITRELCKMCWDIVEPHGHLEKNCPAAKVGGPKWHGLSRLKRPTGIPWNTIQEVGHPTNLEEVLAVDWHSDQQSQQFWRTKSKSMDSVD